MPMLTSNESPSSMDMSARFAGVVRLAHWGVIRAQGEDAAAFLHGQLTQDFALLGMNEARLAGYCNPKGRLLASFIGFKRAADEVLLTGPQDVLPATLKRLSLFVLRAKVRLSDASDAWALWGVVGSDVPRELAQATWSVWRSEAGAIWVRLPPAMGLERALCCADAQAPCPGTTDLPRVVWDWLEVRSAVVMVSQPVVEHFVPQMLNYESVGGVNFKKGCYPGQEVVARSQFRGTLKRRAYLLHLDAEAQAGQDVFHASDAEQPCGTVVQAAPHPDGGWDAIVSMQTAAADGQPLTLGSPNGPALTLLPLPYALLADV